MNQKTWINILRKWKKHYRDETFDKEMADDYFNKLKWFDDPIAERASEEVISRVIAYGRIPLLAEILPIFSQCEEAKHKPVVEPLPEYHESLARMNRLWFDKIIYPYMATKKLDDFKCKTMADNIVKWHQSRRKFEAQIGELHPEEKLRDENFVYGIADWDERIVNQVISDLKLNDLYKRVKKNPPSVEPHFYIEGEISGNVEIEEQIETAGNESEVLF